MKRIKLFTMFFITGILVGAALGYATTPIWSNPGSITIIPVNYNPTVTLSLPNTFPINQNFTITATLNPLPSTPQAVTFFISALPSTSSTTPFTGDFNTGLDYMWHSQSMATVNTVNGVAQISLNISAVGTYYFIAEVANPT